MEHRKSKLDAISEIKQKCMTKNNQRNTSCLVKTILQVAEKTITRDKEKKRPPVAW